MEKIHPISDDLRRELFCFDAISIRHRRLVAFECIYRTNHFDAITNSVHFLSVQMDFGKIKGKTLNYLGVFFL